MRTADADGDQDESIFELISRVLPLEAREIEVLDPIVVVMGEAWSLVLACPWDLVTPHGVVLWTDPSIDDEAWELVGRSLHGVVEAPDGNPVFEFDGGFRVEVHADSDLEPWIFKTDGLFLVGQQPGQPSG